MAESAYLQTNKSPTALTVVILMHGAALGALALSKMEVIKDPPTKTVVTWIPEDVPPPPPPPTVEPQVDQPVQRQVVTTVPPVIKRPVDQTVFDTTPVEYPPLQYAEQGPVERIVPPAPPPPSPPPPKAIKVEPARAKTNLASYVSDADYPAAALRSEEQGATRFRLTVGPDGRVTQCAVTGSSGSSSLDATTCKLMKSRARFIAARDSSGNPTGDTVTSTIRWVLPE